MKLSKRTISFVCAAVMCCLMLSTVYAAGVTVTVTGQTIEQGTGEESVNVPLVISGNTGLAGVQLRVSYDSGLTLTNLTTGDALNTLTFTKPDDLTANPVMLAWDGLDADATNGTIMTMTFTVPKETAKAYSITVTPVTGGNYDGDINDVNVSVVNGTITVEKNAPQYVVDPDIVSGDLYYTLSDDGILTVYSLTGNFGNPDSEYTDIVSTFKKYQSSIKKIVFSDTVSYIGSQSLDGFTGDVTVVISDTVHTIDGYAFARCPSLTMELDENNPYFNIVDGVIYSEDMTKLIYASPTLTGSFTVPATVTTVCDGAFVCSNFENIVIPDTVTTMMTSAYGGDSEFGLCGRVFAYANTKNITIGKNAAMLGRCAVYRCMNLETLTILGTETAFEDDFVIDDEGCQIGVVYVQHNSKAEEYMQNYYNGNWSYISSEVKLPEHIPSISAVFAKPYTYTGENNEEVTVPSGIVFSKAEAQIGNYTLKEYGMLFSKTNIPADDFVIGAEGTLQAKGTEARNAAGQFGVLFYGKAITYGTTYYAIPYAKYEYTDGNISTIYGDAVISFTPQEN